MKHQALFTSFILSLLVAAAALASTVSVLLPNGSTWRGSTGDIVKIEYNTGGVKAVVEGELMQSADRYLVVKKSDGSGEVPIFLEYLVSMESVDAQPATEAPADTGTSKDEASPSVASPASPAKPMVEEVPIEKGVFYLPLKEQVGLEFRPEEIQAIIAQADEAGPGQTIVLDIESGGGSVWEFIVLAEVIRDAKQRHSFVAWVGHSISAAAGTALCCDRLIWKSHGALGAITMHSGGRPVPDATEERWITMLKAILRESGHSEHWARPMVRNDSWISYTKDPVSGDCKWFGTPQGISDEVVLSNMGENVVLNVQAAVDCCLAYDVADSKEELAEALDLPGWRELGTGQKLHDDWMKAVEQCEVHWRKSNVDLELLGSYDPVIAIRKRIKIYQGWIRWWKRAPNKMRSLGAPSVEQLEAMIEELKMQLSGGRG